MPQSCPECKGIKIRHFAAGTQQVEKEVRKLYPQASLVRMDSDTTSARGSHQRLYQHFREGKADILIGTQMIAKGFDFPRVTLVGVVTADTILNLPDFRAAERTFQLLTQVSGRSGRGHGGERLLSRPITRPIIVSRRRQSTITALFTPPNWSGAGPCSTHPLPTWSVFS